MNKKRPFSPRSWFARCFTLNKLCFLSLFLVLGTPMVRAEKNSVSETQQQGKVSGTVTDASGEPIIGASIAVRGTSQGTITDLDGNFTLSNVSPKGTLIISYLGYSTVNLDVNGQSVINITLKEDSKMLDEVVIQVGYAGVKRANLLGSVSNIAASEIEDVVTGNLSTALQGTMAGVTIGQSSGAPGASTSVKIRIPGSWNSEAPLFVIDGFIRDQEAFDILDPSEVESISVLKDASAAVYGARSAGGVILVKTKKGVSGKLKVNYSGTVGFSDATSFPDLMSAYDHATALNDYTRGELKWGDPSGGGTGDEKYVYFSKEELEQLKSLDYNWLDMGWKTAIQTRHNINVSGGSEKARYFAGGAYMYQDGNFDNLSMNKFSMRLGLDVDIAKGWLLTLGMSGDNKSTHMPYNANDKEPEKMYNTYSTLLRTPKWIPAYIDGLPVGQGIVSAHPLYINEINSYNKKSSSNMTGNIALEWDLPWIDGLKAKGSFDYLRSNSGGITYAKPYYLYNFDTEPTEFSTGHILTNVVTSRTQIENGNKYEQSANSGNSYQLNVSLDYAKKVGLHDIKALAVFEQSEARGTALSGNVGKMIIDNVESSAAFGDGVSPVFSGRENTPTGRQSFIGRFNYGYADKYLVEATLRYEASTKFAPKDRWGFFPSVSLGWRASEESFFKDNINPDIMDNLKFRASFGILGNDAGNPLSWEDNYKYTGNVAYLGGSTSVGGISPNNGGLSMLGITWEKANAYNGGFDARFLKSLTFSFDAFYRHNYDILQQRSSSLSYTTGLGTDIPPENYGIQDSWGGEISLGYNGNIGKDWKYNVRGNLGYASSEVKRKYQAAAIIGTWKDEEGRIRGGETGYVATGILSQADVDRILAENPNYTIFGLAPEPGMLNFKDVGSANYSDDPDGKIDENDERIISKYDSPPFNYGLSLGFSWKDIRVDAVFSGQFGNDVFYDKGVYAAGEGNRSSFDWLSEKSNNLTLWNDHWTPENPNASMPRLYKGMGEKRSTFWMVDGHTLAMRSLTVSYNMPAQLSTKFGIPGIRVFFSGTNLWTLINPYPYKDPGLSSWMDYPIMRSFNFGLNLSL